MAPTVGASNSQAPSPLKLPSEKTMAFAMAIVQSTPGDITIREYISLLQQHVAKGRRENRLSSVYRHLDASSYWRMEAKKANDERKNQKRELDAQKIMNETLKRKCDALEVELEVAKMTSSKGKKIAKKSDENIRTGPPVLLTTPIEKGRNVDDEIHQLYSDFTGLDDDGKDVVRCLYNIHSHLKVRENTESSQLVHQLTQTASVVSKIVQSSVKSSIVAGTTTLRSTLVALQRLASFMISGFNHLQKLTNDEPVRGLVVHAYATMFSKILATVDDLSTAEIQKLAHAKTPVAKTKQSSVSNMKEDPSMCSLTFFVCGLLESLDPKNENHKELFEAFAFVILDKIGKTLYISVFGHARASTIEKEILDYNLHNRENSGEVEDTNVTKAKFEAPYLLFLLKHLMAVAPGHLGASINTKGKPKSVTSKTSGKSALALLAKDRLQNTLLTCMYGTESIGEDGSFVDCLRMPISTSAKIPMPSKSEQVDVKEWFQEKVWQLLGWEILSRDGD